LLDSSLRRRARFALRLATFTVIQTAPPAVLIAGAALRVLGEQAVGELLFVCVFSVFVSPVLMPILLFDKGAARLEGRHALRGMTPLA
jgi:hypothetical protein